MGKLFLIPPDQWKSKSFQNGKLSALFLILILVCIVFGIAYYILSKQVYVPEKLMPREKNYLSSVYHDTWNYLSTYISEDTGVPYDSSEKQPITSISNLGLYMASVAVAYRTHLIEQPEARVRIVKCLRSIEKLPQWRGFPVPWFLIRSLSAAHGAEFSYGPHIANLIGGLVVVKTTFPEAQTRVDKILRRMEFKALYDTSTGWLKGGYNLQTDNFAIEQPWGHWYYKYFASETRLLSFYMIAKNAAPKSHWQALLRTTERKENERYYVSGLQDGGILPQFSSSIFLDERTTTMSSSERAVVRQQRKHARRIRSPVWGWSPMENPAGHYLDAGEFRDEITAPYASMMAVIYFPKEVCRNLRELEKLGARQPLINLENLGFRESIDWKSGEISKQFLTIHQAISFLSLANLLYDGVVWKAFGEDPVVQKALEDLR